MKFGKQIKRLADPSHLNHYIAYDVLKKAINVVAGADSGQPEGEREIQQVEEITETFGQSATGTSYQPSDSRFHSLLQHELTKVNRFFGLQIRTLLDKFKESQRALQSYSTGQESEEALSAAERHLEEAADQLVHLENFRRLNFTGFRKIAKKFDKTVKSGPNQVTLSSWFMPSLLREFFVATPLDAHLLALALGYATVRRYRRGKTASAVEATSASASLAPTTTFWLMPAARMRALCTLVKRFEIVVPPQPGSLDNGQTGEMGGEEMAGELSKLLRAMGSDGLGHVPCQLCAETSLVYFDSVTDKFPAYKHRLEESASSAQELSSFHCRHSGSAVGGDLVELDGACSALGVHAFTPVEKPRSAEAFPLAQPEGADGAPHAKDLLHSAACAQKACQDGSWASALDGPSLGKLASFAQQVSQAASKESLSAVASVGCSRLLLRGDTSSTRSVRIALDEDVQFSRDPVGPAAAAPSDAIDFPYCLLEVAGEGGDAKWLEELRGDAALRGVPGFSVGAHAVAALHKDDVSELPHWYEHLSNVESTARPEAWGLVLQWRADVREAQEGVRGTLAAEGEVQAGARRSIPSPSAAAPSSGSAAMAPVISEPSEDMRMLEPKNLLASERTMLEWMHTVLALAFVGIGLWRFSLGGAPHHGHEQEGMRRILNTSTTSSLMLGIYALFLVALAVAFAWYAVFAHLQRLKAFFRSELTERIFNRRAGPVVFGLAVGLALIAHLAVQAAPLWSSLS